MKSPGHFFFGLFGTALSLTLREAAAVFAGLSTGAWMCVQIGLALRRDFKTKTKPKK